MNIIRRRGWELPATTAIGASAWALAGCGDDDDDDNGNGNGGDPTATQAGVRPGTETPPTPTVAGEVINKDGTYLARQSNIFATINPYAGLDSGLLWGFTIFDHVWKSSSSLPGFWVNRL